MSLTNNLRIGAVAQDFLATLPPGPPFFPVLAPTRRRWRRMRSSASSLRTRFRSRSRVISMAYFRADHHHIVASGGASDNAEMYHSASRSPAFARAQYLRESFLITLTLRLQPGDDALIAAAHTAVAFVRFLVQLLT